MLPTPAVSPNVASAILGRSARAVRKLVADGILDATGEHQCKISVAGIERLRGEPVTPTEYVEALAAVERQRIYWRDFQKRRRATEGQLGGRATTA